MAQVYWYGQHSAIEINGRWMRCMGAFTRKDEAQRVAAAAATVRWVRVMKRLSMKSMKGRNDYVWVVWVSTAMKPIRMQKKGRR
jgi:hypothetical protein